MGPGSGSVMRLVTITANERQINESNFRFTFAILIILVAIVVQFYYFRVKNFIITSLRDTMASLIRLAARASHLEIRAPTSIFGWSFHNHQEATGILK